MPLRSRWRARRLSCLLVAAAGCASPLDPTTHEPTAPPRGRPALALASPPGVANARSADAFVNSIGLNVHLGYFRTPYGTAWTTLIKPKLLSLGVRHLRDAGVVVPDDRWMGLYYGRMRELAHHGIRFNLVMRPAEGSAVFHDLPHFDRLMQYAHGLVASFEGLNEHDLSRRPNWASEVRAFQHALYARVKRDHRTAQARVFGPSLGDASRGRVVGNLSMSLDYGALHPYPGGREPLATLAHHGAGHAPIIGQRPVVVTESGYHTALGWAGQHPAVSERAMGRYLLRLLFDYFNAGVPRTYLYELIDQGFELRDREQNFGLLRADGSEKPAYRGLANLIAILADPGPPFAIEPLDLSLAGDTAGVHHTLLAKRDGRLYLVLWTDAPSFDLAARRDAAPPSRRVLVYLPAGARTRIYQPLWSRSPIQELRPTGPLPVDVLDTPVIVELFR